MLTQTSDYHYIAPPSADIAGRIIPTNDIAGLRSSFRREDIYYLLEMYYDLMRKTSTMATPTFDGKIRTSALSIVKNLFENWGSAAGVLENDRNVMRLKNLPAEGIESDITSNRVDDVFWKWFAQAYPQYIMTMPQFKNGFPSSRDIMRADTMRTMYYGMNQPCYEPIAGAGFPSKYTFTVPSGQTLTRLTYDYNSSDDIITTEDIVKNLVIGYSGSIETTDESDSSIPNYGACEVGAIKSLFKSDGDGNTLYKSMNCFPKSDVYCTVNFDASIAVESAFMQTYYQLVKDRNQYKTLFALEPMERISDIQFRFKLFKPSTMARLAAAHGIPWGDDSDWTSSKGCQGTGEVSTGKIYAKIANKYTSLPAEWNWSPGQSV